MTVTVTKPLLAKQIPISAFDVCMPTLAACILRAKEADSASFERWRREQAELEHERRAL